MEQKSYVKKPIPVKASPWHELGDHPEVVAYKPSTTRLVCDKCGYRLEEHGWISTLEGGHIVCIGDYIITGIEGEHYPCKPSIFNNSYEEFTPN